MRLVLHEQSGLAKTRPYAYLVLDADNCYRIIKTFISKNGNSLLAKSSAEAFIAERMLSDASAYPARVA